jgi:hypothetical protein
MAIYKDVEPLEVFAYNGESEEFDEGVKFALEKLDELPEADVVEVVRCEDCKHYFHYGKTAVCVNGKTIRAGWCQRRTRYDEEFRMLPKDFCSYGRKKD